MCANWLKKRSKSDGHCSSQPLITASTNQRELLIFRQNVFCQRQPFFSFFGMSMLFEECQQPLDLSVRRCQKDKDEIWISLKEFVSKFKRHRQKLSKTQGDVGIDLGKYFGHHFSQTTISRFEALSLSLSNMLKLKPFLEEWLMSSNSDTSNSFRRKESAVIQRRHRTSLEYRVREDLEAYFAINTNPRSSEIAQIASYLGIDKGVARVWFCNRYF